MELNWIERVFFSIFMKIVAKKRLEKYEQFNRALPFGDYFLDRWEKAKFLNFAKDVSVYDNVIVIGDVCIGEGTWVGPNVFLDGIGGLKIGSFCSISAGVQIYSHDSLHWSLSGGKMPKTYQKVTIGNSCYIGPNAIIQRGVTIGDGCVIGANSLVNRDIPAYSKAFGTPAKVAGVVDDSFQKSFL